MREHYTQPVVVDPMEADGLSSGATLEENVTTACASMWTPELLYGHAFRHMRGRRPLRCGGNSPLVYKSRMADKKEPAPWWGRFNAYLMTC